MPNLIFSVIEKSTKKVTTDYQKIMEESGLDPGYPFQTIGVQADGSPVIFDKIGNFSYLSDLYELEIKVTMKC